MKTTTTTTATATSTTTTTTIPIKDLKTLFFTTLSKKEAIDGERKNGLRRKKTYSEYSFVATSSGRVIKVES